MSTRGAIGFRYKERDYVTYNHSDSYPGWLGIRILSAAKVLSHLNTETLRNQVSKLKVINDKKTKPTAKDIKALAKYTNLSVSSGSTRDWYCLMRELQGDLVATLKAGYIGDGASFLRDSLFCEYAYIINVDTMELEVYFGFNTDPMAAGRYATLIDKDQADKEIGDDRYYGVRLVQTYPMKKLPSEKRFLADMDRIQKSADKTE